MAKAQKYEFVHMNMIDGKLGKRMQMTQNAATRANNNLRKFGTQYRWVRVENLTHAELERGK